MDVLGRLLRATVFLIAPWVAPSFVLAQVDSRVAEIEAARREKTQRLEPEEVSKTERALLYIKENRIIERFSAGIAGFRVKLGGLISGSGFALGPEYLRRDLADGELIFRAGAQSSFKSYRKFDVEFSLPGFARDKLFFDVYSVHHDYPGVNYYGPGPDSLKAARSNFRVIDTAADATFGIRPFKYFNLGASGGYLHVNVGPGRDRRFVSTDRVFSPAQAPGIDVRPSYLRRGAFAQFDYRDNPGGPRRGGNYVVQFSRYAERPSTGHEFRRLDLSLEQYISFFNQRRVIALHAKSVLTYPDGGQTVPFYLQPYLGGSDDLRGFRPFRFYDNNLILVNAEYRWETFSGLDMALFAEAGKVFPRHSQWNFLDLESSVGFGFRFNVRNNVFLRIDTGFSHEGFQVWFKFNNIFADVPRYSSSHY